MSPALGQTAGAAATAVANGGLNGRPPRTATIVIVNDLSANRGFLAVLLRHQGHRVLEAANGRDGLIAVRSERTDLVITDVLMPVMDGYEFVRELRLDPATRTIPVVFYTAHYGEREARTLALSSGVADVITKPASSSEVLRVVASALAGNWPPPAPDTLPLTVEFDREHLRLLTDKLSEKAGDLRAANARLRAVINIGLELEAERNVEQVLRRMCVATRDLFGATYVTLGIVDRARGTVDHVVACGADARSFARTGDAIPGFLAAVVGDRLASRGVNEGGAPAGLQLPADHPEAHAFLAAPVASPAHVYGWICLIGNEGRAFSGDDEQLVRALAGQVGRIYESRHFHDVAIRRTDELERAEAERRRAEAELPPAIAALRTAEERVEFVLRSADVGIWDMDYTTGKMHWSETSERHYGILPGTFAGTFEAFVERIHPADREAALAQIGHAAELGKDFTVLHQSRWPDGTERWLQGRGRVVHGGDGKPTRAMGITLDITDQRKREAHYQQAQKMEAVGRLAGGVAHDFNNLLGAILGYCELLLTDLAPGDPRREFAEEIQKAGATAAGVTRQLLTFSRKQIVEPTLVDLNEVVTDMRAMLERLIGSDITVRLRLQPELTPVLADRGQLEQVVLNLALNARDAMPNGGLLTIETADVDLDEDYATDISIAPGHYASLIVTDTGVGMTPEVQARLFEPFFTTKELGHGTGLGLSIVHGIVERSGGRVNVYSELGVGTTFRAYFRSADGDRAIIAPSGPAVVHDASATTVLVVEDGAALRVLIRRLLERRGYTVIMVASAAEAIQAFEHNAAIDVVLTDVVMPGGSGPELIQKLDALRPGLRVIYMSGHTEDAIVQRGALQPGLVFLQKPFTSAALEHKLREALSN